MLVGHLAVGLVAKRIAPRVSLGTTVLAAVLPDLLWCLFLLAGIEHVTLGSGRGAVNYLAVSDMAFSHSLLMDTLWAGLLASGYFLARHNARGAWILFAAVISHWLLDYISHRPDMALAPGTHHYFGLGLWYSIPATLLVEGGLWAAAVTAYTRATHARNRRGVYAFWIAIILLTLVWYGNITGAPPPDPRTMALSSLIFFSLVVAWSYWMNRLRPACYNSV